MTTGNDVFDLAVHLMDEQNESNGNTRTQDTKEYEYRSLSILNVLLPELYPYSDTYPDSEDAKRPIAPLLTAMTQPIDLDDAICRGVLPYGLAAHLLLGEDDAKASFFNQRYSEAMSQLRNRSVAVWEDIPVYIYS